MQYEPFTWNAYGLYLDAAIRSCYRFISFENIAEGSRLPDYSFVLLRHDVDYDPAWVIPISRLEAGKGVRATYFFQMDSRFYRFESIETVSVVQHVISNGHWLGLHFDATEIEDDDEIIELVEQFSEEFERRFKCPVTAVSFHMPTYRPVKHLRLQNRRVNTSSPFISGEIEYVSDSNMNWRGKDIHEIFCHRRFKRIQLLVHPIWWRDSFISLSTKIEELAAKLGVTVDDILTKEQRELIDSTD